MTAHQRVYLAPMVRGSELAMRMLVRTRGGVSTCYGPMLRADEVVQAHEHWKNAAANGTPSILTSTSIGTPARPLPLREGAYLCITDTCPEDRPLVMQICGSCPKEVGSATKALIEIYEHKNNPLDGIDLNLGCPQECAQTGGFGAFLVENDPRLAVACVKAMRDAIDETTIITTAKNHKKPRLKNHKKPRLSCKIRLLDDDEDEDGDDNDNSANDNAASTVSFARKLQHAGCDLLTVHCRRRTDKHDGIPDYATGAKIVQALNIPVVINGAIETAADADRVLRTTRAHAVMAAQGFLANPRMLLVQRDDDDSGNGISNDNNRSSTISQQHQPLNSDPAFLAAEYLDFAEKYPPPSSLYIRKHFRWFFRESLQPERGSTPDYSDLRTRLWTFLVRPYLETIDQFRQVVLLYVKINGSQKPPSLAHLPEPTFKSIKSGKKPKPKTKIRKSLEFHGK